jgi:hypothetical protein
MRCNLLRYLAKNFDSFRKKYPRFGSEEEKMARAFVELRMARKAFRVGDTAAWRSFLSAALDGLPDTEIPSALRQRFVSLAIETPGAGEVLSRLKVPFTTKFRYGVLTSAKALRSETKRLLDLSQ